MRLLGTLGILVMMFVVIISCQHEYSFENARTGTSSGTLKTISGDCMPSGSNGLYKKGVAVDSSNYIYVDVEVYVAGTYIIESDKVNGLSFKAEGFFDVTGLQTVRLYATGTPFTNGTVPFHVKYGTQKCIVNVFTIN